MKSVELICNGCVRPITNVPFYKCSQHNCDFVLHEWCTRLPSQIQNYHDHPEHTLVLLPKIPRDSKGVLIGVFTCSNCLLFCNGFAYGCRQCKYFVNINCGFIPEVITHETHPNHILLRFKASSPYTNICKGCWGRIKGAGFHCATCDFYLHTSCALLLPTTIRHKYDKHALSLRYYPAENHSGEYFCEICEDEFGPNLWFYHCSMCASSMHTACAPVKLQCDQLSTYFRIKSAIFGYFNVKFGERYKIEEHPHPVTFVQGIKDDEQCNFCHKELQYHMIFKCFRCKVASHFWCWRNAVVIHDA
ncbi:uncharacterized protein LOC143557238 [Bidens hawaiensis]|uniref:uncharacterized protein LOC143557238 n=1 Tax=Bidens hawaiensis TaxID=980011 RepID=UPI00404A6EC9